MVVAADGVDVGAVETLGVALCVGETVGVNTGLFVGCIVGAEVGVSLDCGGVVTAALAVALGIGETVGVATGVGVGLTTSSGLTTVPSSYTCPAYVHSLESKLIRKAGRIPHFSFNGIPGLDVTLPPETIAALSYFNSPSILVAFNDRINQSISLSFPFDELAPCSFA